MREHLKRFFPFLVVDAKGSCKLQQDARHAAMTWILWPSHIHTVPRTAKQSGCGAGRLFHVISLLSSTLGG
jgi:hypothetical protein